jgi:hypothetical protein
MPRKGPADVSRCDVPRRECLHLHGRPNLRDPRQAKDEHGRPIDSYRALCPAHDDHEHSLSVSIGEKQRIVRKCFAGCSDVAVRAALIRDGWDAGCLGLSRADEADLLEQITVLYAKNLHHAELRWRVWSLVQGFGGEMPTLGRYPGGRRGFFRDAGTGYRQAYDAGGFNP